MKKTTWKDVSPNYAGNAKEYGYIVPVKLPKGTYIEVAFTNDLYLPGIADRNLYVDKINVDGIDYQSEAPSTFSTGTWTRYSGCKDGFKQSQWLHCRGYFRYRIE